jgi:hypothetical protein
MSATNPVHLIAVATPPPGRLDLGTSLHRFFHARLRFDQHASGLIDASQLAQPMFRITSVGQRSAAGLK